MRLEPHRLYGLDVDEHGGGCCGIQHLYGFPTNTGLRITDSERQAWLKRAAEAAVDQYETHGNGCGCDDDEACSRLEENWQCAIEVTLAHTQLPEWRKPLEDFGFKEVYSFKNSNSGNTVHVFFYTTNEGK